MKPETKARLRVALLALAMALLWVYSGPAGLDRGERALWRTVRAAQDHLAAWRSPGSERVAGGEADPWKTGLIGLEWSPTTTTLGELSAKRTACDPLWAVQIARWFDEAGLGPEDHVAIMASSSFPGLVLSALAAAENRGLDILLAVSLGASTWGANDPERPWPAIEAELRRSGFIRTRAAFYTLGGDAEGGGGLSPEGRTALESSAGKSGVPLFVPANLEEAVKLKWTALESFRPLLLVSIGGSHANLGSRPEVLDLPPGFVRPGQKSAAGDGLVGLWLDSGRPVIHLLNIRELAQRQRIPFDSPPMPWFRPSHGAWASLLGLVLFFGVLLTHHRWTWGEGRG